MRIRVRYAAALLFPLLASCAPSIEQSTTRAEAAANRAERSATLAEQSADQAFKASVRALMAAGQIEKNARRADDAVSRLDSPTVVHGELLVKPAEGSLLRWCLMAPPGVQSSPMGSVTVDWHAPRSEFWVGEIFDSKSDCREELRKSDRQLVREVGKRVPLRAFCAACANMADDDED
jgi:hypothetical protein